ARERIPDDLRLQRTEGVEAKVFFERGEQVHAVRRLRGFARLKRRRNQIAPSRNCGVAIVESARYHEKVNETSSSSLGFTHRFLPGTAGGGSPVLLLLHGTGGSENDLLDLGRTLYPGASLLSPRGKVLENGMPRFFRRLAEGVFDKEDLVRR